MSIYLVEVSYGKKKAKRFIFFNQTMDDIVKDISENAEFYGNSKVKSITFKRMDVPSGSKIAIKL